MMAKYTIKPVKKRKYHRDCTMYKGHYTHSSYYYKFIELTLKQCFYILNNNFEKAI